MTAEEPGPPIRAEYAPRDGLGDGRSFAELRPLLPRHTCGYVHSSLVGANEVALVRLGEVGEAVSLERSPRAPRDSIHGSRQTYSHISPSNHIGLRSATQRWGGRYPRHVVMVVVLMLLVRQCYTV